MPWSTLEVRWFTHGPLEASGSGMEAWFRSPRIDGGRPAPLAWEPASPAWREDRYLLIPGQDDMGVKWREGRLEIKGRETVLAPQVFAPGIEGTCERWLKWSYAGVAIEQRFCELFRGGAGPGIVPVEKRRLQRLFRVSDAGDVAEIERDQRRERGVNVELAQIRVRGSTVEAHWTLAFEAFPGDERMSEPFAQIVEGMLEGCPALPLSVATSMGYPRWLRGFDHVA